MKKYILTLLFIKGLAFAQAPALHIHIVSHNEPDDNLQFPLNYTKAKNNVLQLANIVDNKDVKWNLQTSDGFVFGARWDENNTSSNIFETLSSTTYSDNIEVDPRSKNFPGRNIADQWYLLDSLGANPTKTVGGFIYYVCPPNPDSLIDWWKYQDTVTGTYYGNKIKFDLLSGAGSLAPHCNDLNDFGIFKPDTTNNFYHHNPNRDLWCVGTGCAPVLDSLSDEQAIIDLIQGQVDSIQNGLWPSNKFYVTRIMTNQREYGPLFFQKIIKVLDSLKLIPSNQLKWATINETFADFLDWRTSSGLDSSMWQCDEHVITTLKEDKKDNYWQLFPNPTNGKIVIKNIQHPVNINIYNAFGEIIVSAKTEEDEVMDISKYTSGIYFVRIENMAFKIIKE